MKVRKRKLEDAMVDATVPPFEAEEMAGKQGVISCELASVALPEESVSMAHLSSPPVQNTKTIHFSTGYSGNSTVEKRELNITQQERPLAVVRAEDFQLKLQVSFPSFVKSLTKSHVSGSSWISLPVLFCRAHFPQDDAAFTLVDENGTEFAVRYSRVTARLCGGWRRFVHTHSLLEGDVLIFQLIHRYKMKVFIMRGNDVAEINRALTLLNQDDRTAIGYTVDGATVCSGLSDEVRRKYHDLCRSQNADLHENLVLGLNSNLIAGLIAEVVSVADAMKASTLSTPREEFERWEKKLRASEMLGMRVGFMHSKRERMQCFADSEDGRGWRRYYQARSEVEKIEREITELAAKLEELEAARGRCSAEIQILRESGESLEKTIQNDLLTLW